MTLILHIIFLSSFSSTANNCRFEILYQLWLYIRLSGVQFIILSNDLGNDKKAHLVKGADDFVHLFILNAVLIVTISRTPHVIEYGFSVILLFLSFISFNASLLSFLQCIFHRKKESEIVTKGALLNELLVSEILLCQCSQNQAKLQHYQSPQPTSCRLQKESRDYAILFCHNINGKEVTN